MPYLYRAQRRLPLPLHLFLGIGNRIVLEVLPKKLSSSAVEAVVAKVKTVHSASGGGRSDFNQLNGPELARLVQKGHFTDAINSFLFPAHWIKPNKGDAERLNEWLKQLHGSLLRRDGWSEAQKFLFAGTVVSMYEGWTSVTGQSPFPKLHMLRHAAEFAQRHGFLGRASEAAIESSHAQHNRLWDVSHRNQSRNPKERLRRTLRAQATRAAQRPALAELSTNLPLSNSPRASLKRSKSI